MTVRVVTDSTAYLPAEDVQRHGIEVVPLHVIVGGRDHVEGRDVTAEQVAEALRHYTIVTTSRPTPQVFAETYQRLADEGASAVVSIHLSSQMSGTIEAARLAASEAPIPVEVVDSGTLGMAMGFAVIAAAEVAAQGDSQDGTPGVEAVVAAARARLDLSAVLFYVDTLEHLRRGGRIGAASALLGSALAIKPILTVRGGRIIPVEKVRTSSRALARIVAMVGERVRASGLRVDIAVHHLDAGSRAEQLAADLRRVVPGSPRVIVVELGAVVGAHVGPGTVAIALSPRPGEPLPESAEALAP
ncbi:DegV family protein [Humibacillus xanthopallidus]|uniref:DegV family protein n=1 Tax=Humibacillus xanthopallidus TaxID=412689 RepID=UPI003850802D